MWQKIKTQLHLVYLAEIGNLLEELIVKDIITCEERDMFYYTFFRVGLSLRQTI